MAGGALPVLETARLRLRPRTLAELDDCFRLDREPGTLRWVDWPLPEGSWDDEAAHRTLIRARTLHPYPPGLGYWVVARKQHPDEFLGWVLLIPEDASGPEVEIGWRLLDAVRGRGYATEAAWALCRHGFGTAGLERIVSTIYRANTASNRVAEKLGFHQDPDPRRTNETYINWILDRADWTA